jgi:hypothetical protein
METFKKAQKPGWTLTGEAAELIEKAVNIENNDWTARHRAPETRKAGRSPTLNATHWLLMDFVAITAQRTAATCLPVGCSVDVQRVLREAAARASLAWIRRRRASSSPASAQP